MAGNVNILDLRNGDDIGGELPLERCSSDPPTFGQGARRSTILSKFEIRINIEPLMDADVRG
jgi:hypothetical protein